MLRVKCSLTDLMVVGEAIKETIRETRSQVGELIQNPPKQARIAISDLRQGKALCRRTGSHHDSSPPQLPKKAMRRGAGLAALDRSAFSSAQYSSLGSELGAQQIVELRQQLDVFASALRQFATSHRADIRRDAAFRHAFQRMCANIGVDPLAGGGPSRGAGGGGGMGRMAGLWNDLLGLGDWQYELGVQIIDVCVSTRHLNGGLIAMADLIRALTKLRTGKDPVAAAAGSASAPSSSARPGTKTRLLATTDGFITEDDIARSIRTLRPLGCGYEILKLGDRKLVRSVPRELDTDSTAVLALLASSTAEKDVLGLPFVTILSLVRTVPASGGDAGRGAGGSGGNGNGSPSGIPAGSAPPLAWTDERARTVLDRMTLGPDAMLWVDRGAHPERYYSLSIVEGVLGALPPPEPSYAPTTSAATAASSSF